MARENPKWPSSLPLPLEMRYGPRAVNLAQVDLATAESIADLVHDLFWFPNDNYYLFTPAEGGIDERLYRALESQGIETPLIEMYFYPHPEPVYKNDFVRIPPHEDLLLWQEEALRGAMYSRRKLTLESATRIRLNNNLVATTTRDTIADAEDVVEAKPNIYGIGINFNSLYRKIVKWTRRKV